MEVSKGKYKEKWEDINIKRTNQDYNLMAGRNFQKLKLTYNKKSITIRVMKLQGLKEPLISNHP